MSGAFKNAVSALGREFGFIFDGVPERLRSDVREIRLRVGMPVTVTCGEGQYAVRKDMKIGREQLERAYIELCGHCVYSHQTELANGFITVGGGHRAGFGCTAVINGGKVSAVREVSSINLRVARQIIGCADSLCRQLFEERLYGTLLAGPPGSGKTTLLRDIALTLSGRMRRRVTLADERGELAAVCAGVPQLKVGECCDVLAGFPKRTAIEQAVRCLSPEAVVCDEIGGKEAESLAEAVNSGAVVIASVHAYNAFELAHRRQIMQLLETQAFQRLVFLGDADNPSGIKKIMELGEFYEAFGSRSDTGMRSAAGQ